MKLKFSYILTEFIVNFYAMMKYRINPNMKTRKLYEHSLKNSTKTTFKKLITI